MSLDNNDYFSRRLSGFGQRFRKNRGEREFNTSTMSSITDCGDLSLLDASSWASGDGMDSRGQQRCAFDDSSSTLLSNFDFGQLFHRKNNPSEVNVNVQKKEDKEGGDEDDAPHAAVLTEVDCNNMKAQGHFWDQQSYFQFPLKIALKVALKEL
eukprot:CAMPEP_0196180132 /NCGR_PEP_ID=MMETSP0911-20130528/23144_1 /TAXON_ID=49265 /ORGANISM="Thalassiosira rotula, Strain GSO102" /LENGTH=153 /DNA_ID=CAMNT_0041449135 /DNA_START=21 /DNA_END=483 /DNA_ORIENTATION=-